MAKEKNVEKTVTGMPPTLLVGLGGTGCEIVGRVYALASAQQQKSIQFAFLDTDANELRERKLKAPQAHTVQTSRRITVGQALRDDPYAFENTFPVNPQLMNKPLTEGAGQIRAVSKLAFDMCVREGKLSGLHEAINNLQKLNSDDMEQSIRVLIVSTLVGGTGSGIILPVAMYLRNYLENFCNKKPIIRAFCMLPEIFFNDTGKTEVEKSNLRTNAYATLRELDAFMLRANSSIDDEIRTRFTLKMPKPGAVGQYEEYDQNPLDYCFLFDAQNQEGETLSDLQAYKKHAAECIYASSISRLHKRLNSSEDNTILERCAQNGRNRYCGVGAAKLIYPDKAVRDYVALNWMSQAMTEDWLRYDNMVDKERERRQNSRKRGVSQPPVDERELYRTFVKEDIESNSKNYFSVAISEETYELDKDGFVSDIPRWSTYLDNLAAFIDDKSNNTDNVDSEDLRMTLSNLRSDIDGKHFTSFREDFIAVTQRLKVFFRKVHKKVEIEASIVADRLYSVDSFDAEDKSRIESYLVKNGVPVHPNSARFFLYNLEKELKEQLQKINTSSEISELQIEGEDETFPDVEKYVKEFFEAKEYTNYRDEESGNVNIVASANSLELKTFKKARFAEGAIELLDYLDQFIEAVHKYYGMYIKVSILQKAINFIDDLCKNYEHFYRELGAEIKGIQRKIERIEESYENIIGNPVINVCSSAKCLKALLEDCPNIVDSIRLTDAFRTKLFDAIYKNSSADAALKSRQQRQIISELVSDDILDFWRNAVLDEYPSKVDMDIIEALLTEAEYEDDALSIDDQLLYVEKKYREAVKLSSPFIDRPVGQPYNIHAVGMSSAIKDPDDVLKTRILEIFGHYEPDSLMDKNQILVMTALYNLKASDLKKFASDDPHPADPRAEGSYFKDYVARIDNVLPDSKKSNIITPHLDRRWHFAGVLPDFEDKTEVLRQTEAQQAFLIAMAYGYVRFDRDQYKFTDSRGGYINEKIVVRDGRCDKLHEVYDALSISRPLVRDFLERFASITREERDEKGLSNVDFDESLLYKNLKKMHFNKFDFIPVVSFLEIPLLYKSSVGNGTFNSDDAIVMLHNFINLVDAYLTNFYTDNIRRTEYLIVWLKEQVDLMFDNVSKYYNTQDNIIIKEPFDDAMLECIVNNVVVKFDALNKITVAGGAASLAVKEEWEKRSGKKIH